MSSSRRLWLRASACTLLIALPACSVTFRRKPIEPLDNDRNYEVAIEQCWETSKQVVTDFVSGIEDQTYAPGNQAGMIVTEFAILSDTGDDDYNHLKRVAYARGASFIGGRYQLTVTTRLIRGGRCKVRIVARIEGYMGEEFGYQTLRSTGVIEEEIFGRISTALGTEPVAEG